LQLPAQCGFDEVVHNCHAQAGAAPADAGAEERLEHFFQRFRRNAPAVVGTHQCDLHVGGIGTDADFTPALHAFKITDCP